MAEGDAIVKDGTNHQVFGDATPRTHDSTKHSDTYETTGGAQAKVDAHVNDSSDAHDASAISILDTANDFAATDVEGALAELQADAEAHLTGDPHPTYLTQTEGDARYGQLAADNSWTEDQTFAKGLQITGKRDALIESSKTAMYVAPAADDVDGIIIRRNSNTYGVGHTANLLAFIKEGTDADINNLVLAHINEWGGGGAQTWHVRPGVNYPTLKTDYDISNIAFWVEDNVDVVGFLLDKAAGLTPTQDFMRVRDQDVGTYLTIDKDGYLLLAKTTAPDDASLATSEFGVWLDDNLVSPRVMFKSKDSGGNPKTNFFPAGTPLRRFEAHVISGATTMKDLGYNPTLTSPGVGAAAADDLDGAWVVLSTAASTGSVAGLSPGAEPGFYRDWYPELSVRMRTAATITNTRCWVGLFASDPSGSADPAIHGAGFRRDTGAGDTNWQAWSNDASGGGTITDTGVAGAASTMFRHRIVFGASKIDFYINGKLVASHTTNLPALVTKLYPYQQNTTLNNTAKSMRVGSVLVECV